MSRYTPKRRKLAAHGKGINRHNKGVVSNEKALRSRTEHAGAVGAGRARERERMARAVAESLSRRCPACETPQGTPCYSTGAVHPQRMATEEPS